MRQLGGAGERWGWRMRGLWQVVDQKAIEGPGRVVALQKRQRKNGAAAGQA